MYFCPSDTRLNQLNIGIVGDLGTGKTQLVQSLLHQLAKSANGNRGNAPRILVLDYKKDYSKDDFAGTTNALIIHPEGIPLNFFYLAPESRESTVPQAKRARAFIDVIKKIYSGVGPVQTDCLRKAILQAYGQSPSKEPTIYDVESAYRDIVGDKIDSVLAILGGWNAERRFEADPRKLKTFDALMEENPIVVLSLGDLDTDEDGKRALIALFLNLYYDYMNRREKKPYEDQKSGKQLRMVDSFLVVDEAVNILKYDFPALKQLLLQGREFGVGVILASQFLSHFKTGKEDYMEPLLTWFLHKVPDISRADLQSAGIKGDLDSIKDRIGRLPNLHCFYWSLDLDSENFEGHFIKSNPFFKLLLGES